MKKVNETGICTNLKKIMINYEGSATNKCSRQTQGEIIGFLEKEEELMVVI